MESLKVSSEKIPEVNTEYSQIEFLRKNDKDVKAAEISLMRLENNYNYFSAIDELRIKAKRSSIHSERSLSSLYYYFIKFQYDKDQDIFFVLEEKSPHFYMTQYIISKIIISNITEMTLLSKFEDRNIAYVCLFLRTCSHLRVLLIETFFLNSPSNIYNSLKSNSVLHQLNVTYSKTPEILIDFEKNSFKVVFPHGKVREENQNIIFSLNYFLF